MNIYLINHTEVYNPNDICYGQSEMPLTENFTNTFSAIQDRLLLDLYHTEFISSPLKRCTKLTSFLSDDNFKIDNDFSEVNFGDWETKEWKNISHTEIENWKNAPFIFQFPNGENLQVAKNRIIKGYKKALKSKKENVVIVCHSSTIRLIIAFVLGLNIKNIDRLSVFFGSVHKIHFDRINKEQTLIYTNLF